MKFVDPARLTEALNQIAQLAKKEGVRVALCGGFAMQLYGSDRLTGDLDVVANKLITTLPEGTPLTFGGNQTEAPNGVPTDIIVRTDQAKKIYTAALTAAKRISSVPVPVVTPEFLAVMKLVAKRGKDELDLEFLIKSKVIDLKKTRALVEKLVGWFAADEFDSYVSVAQWKASQGK